MKLRLIIFCVSNVRKIVSGKWLTVEFLMNPFRNVPKELAMSRPNDGYGRNCKFPTSIKSKQRYMPKAPHLVCEAYGHS